MSEKEKRFSHGFLGTTFQEDQNFVSLRFQKMVPIFDVDLNEMDDIRRFHTEQLWRLLFGEGPSVMVLKEWEKSQGTFMGYKSEAEPGHGNPRDFVPFAPNITGNNDNLVLHEGDFYWKGYWIHTPRITDLEDYMNKGSQKIDTMIKSFQNQSQKISIPPLKTISKVLKELSTSTQVCVLAVHAFFYLFSPEEDPGLKRPVGGGMDGMPTCSRIKLAWFFRFLQIDEFYQMYEKTQKAHQPPLGGDESLCPLKEHNKAPGEVLFPLYAFQIKDRKIDSISKTQSNLLKFQEWALGGTFSPQNFQKAYDEIGSFGQYNLEKIYIKRLRNLLKGI